MFICWYIASQLSMFLTEQVNHVVVIVFVVLFCAFLLAQLRNVGYRLLHFFRPEGGVIPFRVDNDNNNQ